MAKLVLFDIDGILLRNNFVDARPSEINSLIKRHYGLDVVPGASSTDGMTDRGTLAAKLKGLGVKDPERDPRFEAALSDHVNITKETVGRYGVEKIAGVEGLIRRLLELDSPHRRIILGVLTGNTPSRARLKLETAGLWNYFTVGAFGDRTTVRSELVPIALKDARDKTGISFGKKDVFIIGDTVRDVQCAREAGVTSIAVATGKTRLDVLQNEKPDFVFNDFSDADAIIRLITKD